MAAPKAPDGTVVTNKQTGEKLIKIGGAWVKPSVSDPSAPGASYFGQQGGIPKLSPQDQKYLADQRDAATAAMSMAADADRFSQLNQTVKTGELGGWGPFDMIGRAVDPKRQEMAAIAERMVPLQRQAGSGVMSDKDVLMYRAATVGTDKLGPTNQAIAGVLKAGAQRQSDYSAFIEEWARRNGTTVGAYDAWQAYAAANPLYSQGPTGTVVRKTAPWRQWFGVASPSNPAAVSPPPAAAKTGGPVSGARLTPEQASKLPKGAKFIGMDGVARVRQ